jgi:uncharacterized protein YjiS (DUF1127 family)
MSSLPWPPGRALAAHIPSAIAVELRARRTTRVLRSLSDHMLADIGVVRHEIEAAMHSLEPRSGRGS